MAVAWVTGRCRVLASTGVADDREALAGGPGILPDPFRDNRFGLGLLSLRTNVRHRVAISD
jgi:hypothetical protein